ncbi:MAG: hypothetical protein DRN92_06770, partial [Thermoproteota archaeon]
MPFSSGSVNEGHLPEDLANFLGEVTLVEEKDLMELFERGLDLSVPEDPRIDIDFLALLHRAFYKLIHVFGYPKIGI